MTDTQATFMATLVDEWVRSGVADAVVCPGNRSSIMNAALMFDRRLRLHSFVDERSAGFFALGMAMYQRRPVVVWTTSGTAVSELRPAAVEADLAGVPLVVATADRPSETHHLRDWQSTDQSRVFDPHLRWHHDPGVATESTRQFWRSVASRSIIEAVGVNKPGPVHLNIPIREPWTWQPGALPVGRADQQPWHDRELKNTSVQTVSFSDLAGHRGVIAAGAGVPGDKLIELSNALGWPVVADVRCEAAGGEGVVSNLDLLMSAPDFSRNFVPETVLHVGAPQVSKSVSKWLSTAENHIVAATDPWMTNAIDASQIWDVDWATATFESTDALAGWKSEWVRAGAVAEQFALGSGFNEPEIARALSQLNCKTVFLGTSMPIRDWDTYAVVQPGRQVFANRGASGMDGLVSTAAGICAASDQPTLAVVGDLSFLYDLGALWNIDRNIDLTVVVLDNNGGGIFELMPQLGDLDRNVLEELTITPRHQDPVAIAQSMGHNAERVTNLEDLEDSARKALENKGVDVLVATVDRSESKPHRDDVRANFASYFANAF